MPHNRPVKGEARCWGEESDFIWKASKSRRWWTIVLKSHLSEHEIWSFFYVRKRRKRGWGGGSLKSKGTDEIGRAHV